MAESLIVIATLFILFLIWKRASFRFRENARLPMQWTFGGRVTWTAPRRIALAFIPVLAIVVLACALASSFLVEPRQGQEDAVVPAFGIMGAMFIGVYALHTRLIGWSLERSGK